MCKYPKRMMISLNPEWEPKLNKLKKEKFYNSSKAEMFRYLIKIGLEALKDENTINDLQTTK